MNLSRDYTKRIPTSELESIKGGELAKIIVEALHHEAIPSRMYAVVQLILEEAFDPLVKDLNVEITSNPEGKLAVQLIDTIKRG